MVSPDDEPRPRATLPHEARIRKTAEFQRVYKAHHSAADDRLLVFVLSNSLEYPRIGASVSRKVGKAVLRNRWKRLIREAFRLEQLNLPKGFDLVVIPRAITVPTLLNVRESLVKLAARATRRSRESGS